MTQPDLHPPVLSVTTSKAGLAPGYLFLSAGAPMIADNKGEPVWYMPLGRSAANLRVQQYQGERVVTWWEGEVTPTGHGDGDYVILDGSYRQVLRFGPGNGYSGDLHEFQLTPRQTALVTAYTTAPADLSGVGGPARGQILDSIVQEVDPRSGRVVFEWHSKDHVDPTESKSKPTSGQPFDYFHVNSIAEEANGDLVVSARNTWTVYRIDRASGTVIRRIGGKRSDYSLGPGARFAWQHDARPQPGNRLTIFDDEASPSEASQSRAILLQLDPQTRRASLLRQFVHPAPLLAGSQGSAQVLPNSNLLVGWGALPNVSEFSPDGGILFDASWAGEDASYRAFRFPWVGIPASAPAVAARSAGPGEWRVYSSWNGATKVVAWQVLAGRTPDGLTPLTAATRAGFETMIPVRTDGSYLAVLALDEFRRPLGRSPTAQL